MNISLNVQIAKFKDYGLIFSFTLINTICVNFAIHIRTTHFRGYNTMSVKFPLQTLSRPSKLKSMSIQTDMGLH